MSLTPQFSYGDPQQGNGQFVDMKESGNGSFAPTESSATRVFLVDYSIADSFIDYAIGFATGSFGAITREPPDQHPDFATLYCTKAQLKGYGTISAGGGGGFGGVFAFPYGVIECEYTQLEYQIGPSPDYQNGVYITSTSQISSQYLTKQGFMYWASRTVAPLQLQTPPGFQVPQQEIILTEWCVPGEQFAIPNVNNIYSAIGCVNSASFEGVGAGGVLYTGCVPTVGKPQLHQENGQPPIYSWKLEHHFLIRDNGPAASGDGLDTVAGHNYVFDAGTAAATGNPSAPCWDCVLSQSNGSPPVAGAAFTADAGTTPPGGYRLYPRRYDFTTLFS